jgi:hypothetical protein
MNSEKYMGYLESQIADILDVATHCSCLLGGKIIRVNACLSPQGKVPFASVICL